MFKISFKEDSAISSKVVERPTDKVTIVSLRGVAQTPKFWFYLPREFDDYIYHHPNVEVYESLIDLHQIIIKVSGKAVRAEEDIDNPVLAERIAEARAKLSLYKYMAGLISRIMKYYAEITYGNREISTSESHTTAPHDCLFTAYNKYLALTFKESQHLNKLLEEA